LLLPWPNRVDGGRYTFDGKQLQLDLSEPAAGNAIHGLTRWLTWAAAEHTADRVVLRYTLLGRTGYPFCLVLEAEYRLDPAGGLRLQVTASNEGGTRAPYGTGSHPYPAARWLPPGDRGIPAGPPRDVAGTPYDFRTPRAVGDVRLDHPLTALDRDADGRAWVSLAGPMKGKGEAGGGARLWAGPGYRWLQVFSGDPLAAPQRRRALAVEPMTCPPNAFVTGDDLLVLEPGDTVQHAWGVQAIG
jgi:aldose 1-epimerase